MTTSSHATANTTRNFLGADALRRHTDSQVLFALRLHEGDSRRPLAQQLAIACLLLEQGITQDEDAQAGIHTTISSRDTASEHRWNDEYGITAPDLAVLSLVAAIPTTLRQRNKAAGDTAA